MVEARRLLGLQKKHVNTSAGPKPRPASLNLKQKEDDSKSNSHVFKSAFERPLKEPATPPASPTKSPAIQSAVANENEFADAANSFDDQEEGEVQCGEGCQCGRVCEEDRQVEQDAYSEENYRESERDESEDESEDRFSELKQTFPHDRQMDSNLSESESDNESEPEVSADGFLTEDPGASARSSVRSSIRSDFRSSIDFRSSVRSSMRSCIDRYSMDSQYKQSMDGDRVASTFDFIRGGDNEESDGESDILTTLDSRGYSRENPQAEVLAPLRVPQSRAGLFKSKSDSEEGWMRAIAVHKTGAPHPGSQVRRMDRTMRSPRQKKPASSALRRLADKSEVVYGHAEEGGSGRVGLQRQVAAMRASPQKRKTVTLRPDRPVVIEPNLRDRSLAHADPLIGSGNKRIVSGLRTTPKPPTRAELAAKRVEQAERRQRDRSDVIHSPGSSFGSLQRIGVASPNSSFNSLPRNMGKVSGSAPNLFYSLPRNIGKNDRTAMLAYDEHDADEERESDDDDEDNINVNQLGGQVYNGNGVRGSLRHRARSVSTREMRFPPDGIPGKVPEPPPPFAPQDTRVRSVRRARVEWQVS